MARLTQKSLDDAFARGGSSTDAYESVKKRQQTTQENQAERDAQIARLIKGDELKQQGMARQISEAERLRGQYGPEANVNVEGVSIGGVDPLNALLKRRELSQPKLTPGQETSEKEGGKKISAYSLAGGSPAMQKTLSAQEEVLKELRSGKRDMYDRMVGGALSKFPAMQRILAPTEKARKDKIQAAAIQNIRATDSNPAQVLIDQTLSRAYDENATDEQNIERIMADYATAKATQEDMERATGNLQRTGYIMPGLAGNPAGSPGGPPAPQQQSGQRPPSFEEWKRMKAGK